VFTVREDSSGCQTRTGFASTAAQCAARIAA
jgi:hypothetical protein